jgi:hypothetical protein
MLHDAQWVIKPSAMLSIVYWWKTLQAHHLVQLSDLHWLQNITGHVVSCPVWYGQWGQDLQLHKRRGPQTCLWHYLGHSYFLNVWIDPTFDAIHSLVSWNLHGGVGQGIRNSLSFPILPCEMNSSCPTVLAGQLHTQTWGSLSVWWWQHIHWTLLAYLWCLCGNGALDCHVPSLSFL